MKSRPMGVSSKSEVCGNLCQCQASFDNKSSSKASSDNLFSPIKNKMKVLKKIKKRMGLGRTSFSAFCVHEKPMSRMRGRGEPAFLFVIMIRQLIRAHGKMQPEKFSRNFLMGFPVAPSSRSAVPVLCLPEQSGRECLTKNN